MRALLLRRTAFVATLVTGLALTASAVHGLSGMDRSLELAAAPAPVERTAVASWDDCDRGRDRERRV